MKQLLTYPKSLTTASILIAQTGLLLFIAEFLMLGAEVQGLVWTLVAITMLPMLFFACLTKLELQTVEKKRQAKSGTLIGAYMLFKGVRLMVTLVAVAIYIYVGGPLKLMFVANMLILFLVALLLTSICHLLAERRH